MARLRERLFAGFGALLFLGSACAVTLAVALSSNSSTDSTASKSTTDTSQTCTDAQTEEKLTAPDIYKPDGGTVTDLQSTDLAVGTGAAAKSGDCLVVKYYGTLASDGTMFDENFTSDQGFAFTLGSSQVIQGWEQGLVGMKVGGERRLVIPATLGYGDQATGNIPANSTLVFVVKLLRIQG